MFSKDRPSLSASLPRRASHQQRSLWTDSPISIKVMIVSGSFPSKGMALGESLTSDSALVRRIKGTF